MSEAKISEPSPEPVVWHEDEGSVGVKGGVKGVAVPNLQIYDDIDADYLASGELVVRNTYAQIEGELKVLREEKELIQARINDLVEAEQLWRPLIHRLDNGIQRRSTA